MASILRVAVSAMTLRTRGGYTPTPPPTNGNILLESGDIYLLESGGNYRLE